MLDAVRTLQNLEGAGMPRPQAECVVGAVMEVAYLVVDRSPYGTEMHFATLDKRLTVLEQIAESLDKRMTAVENRLTVIEQRLIALEQRVAELEIKVVRGQLKYFLLTVTFLGALMVLLDLT